MYGAAMAPPSSWSNWLGAQLAERDWTQADLVRASNPKLDDSAVSRWRSGQLVPQLANIRIVCRALGVPAVEGMIAAGRLEPEDLGITFIQQRACAADLTARELAEEITRRLTLIESAEQQDQSR